MFYMNKYLYFIIGTFLIYIPIAGLIYRCLVAMLPFYEYMVAFLVLIGLVMLIPLLILIGFFIFSKIKKISMFTLFKPVKGFWSILLMGGYMLLLAIFISQIIVFDRNAPLITIDQLLVYFTILIYFYFLFNGIKSLIIAKQINC